MHKNENCYEFQKFEIDIELAIIINTEVWQFAMQIKAIYNV
jgi:hypothetical protein